MEEMDEVQEAQEMQEMQEIQAVQGRTCDPKSGQAPGSGQRYLEGNDLHVFLWNGERCH